MTPADHVSDDTRVLELDRPLLLECGARLERVLIAYRTWGRLAGDGGNAVVVCHALTGSADADRWWAPLFGAGRALDPARDFIVCSNVLGSCYGTTGPADRRCGDAGPPGADFPPVTVRDMVRAQMALADALGIRRIELVVGGSLGGMQVLEWALMDPARVRAIAPIAAAGRHSAWCIGISAAQRAAIAADPRWQGGRYDPADPPAAGLAAARAMAMVSYRSRDGFERRFGRAVGEDGSFEVERYLHHHGRSLVARFDANAYVALTRAMDTHDVARGRGACEAVLAGIEQPALVIGITSDGLYPIEEQRELARHLPNAELAVLDSPIGHDAFLVEAEAVERLIAGFRARVTRRRVSPGDARVRDRQRRTAQSAR